MDLNFDENILERLLLEYDDESYECESVINEKSMNHVDKKTLELLEIQLKNKLSYKSTADVAKLVNSGADFIVPDTVKKIKSEIKVASIHEYFVICKCKNLVKDAGTCSVCNITAKKNSKKNNFIVSFPLLPQIKSILMKYYEQIMQYMNRERMSGILSDIDDSEAFKKLAARYPHSKLLSFTMNSDGAALYRSSKGSLWITQLYQNYLPPDIRYRTENILIVSLYFGVSKPDPFHLVSLLANEMDNSEIFLMEMKLLHLFQ